MQVLPPQTSEQTDRLSLSTRGGLRTSSLTTVTSVKGSAVWGVPGQSRLVSWPLHSVGRLCHSTDKLGAGPCARTTAGKWGAGPPTSPSSTSVSAAQRKGAAIV